MTAASSGVPQAHQGAFWTASTAAADRYPTDGHGGVTGTAGSAIWAAGTEMTALADTEFEVLIERIIWGPLTAAGTLVITELRGGASLSIPVPYVSATSGPYGNSTEVNLPMRGGFKYTVPTSGAAIIVFRIQRFNSVGLS